MFLDSSHSGYSDWQGVYTTGELGFVGFHFKFRIQKFPDSWRNRKVLIPDSSFVYKRQNESGSKTFRIRHESGNICSSVNVVSISKKSWKDYHIINFTVIWQCTVTRTSKQGDKEYGRRNTAHLSAWRNPYQRQCSLLQTVRLVNHLVQQQLNLHDHVVSSSLGTAVLISALSFITFHASFSLIISVRHPLYDILASQKN